MTGDSKRAKPNLLSITSLIFGLIAFPCTLDINFLATGDSEFSILFIPGLIISTVGLVFGHASLRKIRHSNGLLGGRRTSIGGVCWATLLFSLQSFGHLLSLFSPEPNLLSSVSQILLIMKCCSSFRRLPIER